MTSSAQPTDIVSSTYVSFTTFRRTGTPVATPVWIAPLPDGRLGFTTCGTSGKVKRLRHTPRVTLQPCDMRGGVDDAAPVVEATAQVHTDPETMQLVQEAIKGKYGLQARLLFAQMAVTARVTRWLGKTPGARAVVTVTPAA